MKKLTSLLILIVMSIAVAVTARAEFRHGVTAGVTISTLKFKQDLFTVDRGVGPQVGWVGEMMFPGIGFGIDLGAYYSMEGATLHLGERKIWAADGYGKERSYLHNLQIPVNLKFKWTRMNGVEDYWAPYVFGGPVFDFIVGHNRIKALEYATGSVGIQAGLGFELKRRWQIQGSYMWGMTYALRTVKLTDFSARNYAWSIRVNYFF